MTLPLQELVHREEQFLNNTMDPELTALDAEVSAESSGFIATTDAEKKYLAAVIQGLIILREYTDLELRASPIPEDLKEKLKVGSKMAIAFQKELEIYSEKIFNDPVKAAREITNKKILTRIADFIQVVRLLIKELESKTSAAARKSL